MPRVSIKHKSPAPLVFKFKNSDGSAVDPSAADEIRFALKEGRISGLQALVARDSDDDVPPDLEITSDSVSIVIKDSEWANIPSGTYVCDFTITVAGKPFSTETLTVDVEPAIEGDNPSP